MYIPERGDIFHLDFDPAAGTEMKGGHFALALSPKSFNRATGLVFSCPISQGTALGGGHGNAGQRPLPPTQIFGLENPTGFLSGKSPRFRVGRRLGAYRRGTARPVNLPAENPSLPILRVPMAQPPCLRHEVGCDTYV